jgi:hypothetical protein
MGGFWSTMVGGSLDAGKILPGVGPVINLATAPKPKPRIPVPLKPRPITAQGLWNQFRALPPDVQAASGLGVASVLALLLGGA